MWGFKYSEYNDDDNDDDESLFMGHFTLPKSGKEFQVYSRGLLKVLANVRNKVASQRDCF